MRTRARNLNAKTRWKPELDTVFCVAKSVAGVAIIGLIGVIGIQFNESGRDKLAGNASVNAPHMQTAEAPSQHEATIQERTSKMR
jgi:hypothetical protein